MADWMAEYSNTDNPHERYKILRREMARLRETRSLFDREIVAGTVRRLNERQEGELIVFVANDFGRPMAYRPEDTGIEIQDAVRQAILENKYDEGPDDLNNARQELLKEHPNVHKAIVAEINAGTIRYYLPEGSNTTTNFITVREMVGLIDYTTNSSQSDGLSITY
ncbi:hypothetical protein [Halocatena salina]|uniref:Uncharacterized protein n=1 Tax=Halocatena salina TaxID=2934340 RepID=A0A8U0A5E9_9EURY|nr:hypothetical protein [Halocatena salina]UPM43137.1 hypothetical protein MW046_01500 [Halocatena salina]